MPPLVDCESNTSTLHATNSRNERFESDQPFDNDASLSLKGATGALKFLNPTSALYSWSGWGPSNHHPVYSDLNYAEERASLDEERPHHRSGSQGEREGLLPTRHKDEALGFVWRSRDNRKGRHALALRLGDDGRKQQYGTLKPTNSFSATLQGIWDLFTKFPYWDLSWCIAIVYTFGSIIWVANGVVSVLQTTSQDPPQALQLANTWVAFAGASIFFIGSYLLFLEAVNANRGGCFGWAVERIVAGGRSSAQVKPGDCGHHYHEQHKHPQAAEVHDDNQSDNGTQNNLAQRNSHEDPNHLSYDWVWWPTWRDLRTRLFHELGFIACSIQLVSGSVFFLVRFTTLPGITEYMSQFALDGANWTPQIVGCVGFITASWLFMLETQPRWYIPAPRILGWHVGFWKLIGCTGFLLSAIFSPLGQHGFSFAEKQSSISSLWGSCMVLIGSVIQWYESLQKHPVIQEGTSQYSEWNRSFIQENGEAEDKERV